MAKWDIFRLDIRDGIADRGRIDIQVFDDIGGGIGGVVLADNAEAVAAVVDFYNPNGVQVV